MSHRPITEKRARRLRKAFRRTPDAHINLIEWLRDRGHAKTNGAAVKLLLDGKVKVDSHTVGRVEVELFGKKEWVVQPLIPAAHRKSIVVNGK